MLNTGNVGSLLRQQRVPFLLKRQHDLVICSGKFLDAFVFQLLGQLIDIETQAAQLLEDFVRFR